MPWIIPFIPPTKEECARETFRELDKERKKKGEVWHYTCDKGHKWESYSSPTSTFVAEKFGMMRTRCPKCFSDVTKGEVYINGVKTNMGAIHVGFLGVKK